MELTRACALACDHCRAESRDAPDADDLTTAEIAGVLDDLASLGAPRPVIVLSGGDPLRRPDLTDIVSHASRAGLTVAVSPAGTPLATDERLAELRGAGASAVSFSIDGSPATHDGFRGVPGSYDWTVAGCRAARRAGLRLQVNTTVSARTVRDLPAVARTVMELGASLWSVFFLVPVGRGAALGALSADETEDVLVALHEISGTVPLKTTEAPQYRRVVLGAPAAGAGAARAGAGAGAAGAGAGAAQGGAGRGPLYHALHRGFAELVATPPTAGAAGKAPADRPRTEGRRPLAVGDGRGVVFVSRRGDVCPSGFLPLVAGNVRTQPLTEIYARAPLLRSLRDPEQLKGRCGRCELATVCGGSRAQAYAATGDPLQEDPRCPYVPAGAAGARHGTAASGSVV